LGNFITVYHFSDSVNVYTEVSFSISIKTVFINCYVTEMALWGRFAELDNHLLQ